MSGWQEILSWARDAGLERESPSDLVCNVLECERAIEEDGTEGVESAIEG
jgi:hypothetical protein